MLSGYALTDQGFKDSFRNSSVGLVIMTLDGRFLEVNNAFKEMLGYTELEMLNLSFPLVTHPDDLGFNLVSVHKMLQGKISGFVSEKRYLHKNGTHVWARSNVSFIRDENGLPQKLVAIVQNIDDLKRSEIALKEALSYRDNFLMIASHELRTPITTIKLSAQMIKRVLESDVDTKVLIEKIGKLTDLTDEGMTRLCNLIDNMLDISRIQEGKFVMVKETVDISRALRKACDHYRDSLRKADIKLICFFQDGVLVNGDTFRLEQVFTNIIRNTIQHSQGSRLKVSMKTEGDKIQISFLDNGPGIDEKDHAKIFGHFERLDPASKSGGLGLGLFIARSVITDHGGTIAFNSEKNEGTEFVIRLPVLRIEKTYSEATRLH